MKAKKKPGHSTNASDSPRLRYFEERLSELVQTIREFVDIESPSDNKLAADRMGALLAAKFESRGDARMCTALNSLATTCKSISPARRDKPSSCWAISIRSIPSAHSPACLAKSREIASLARACST
jgi:hypothetical protein